MSEDDKIRLSDWDLIDDPYGETEPRQACGDDEDGLSSIFKVLSSVELEQTTTTYGTTSFGQGESSNRGEKRKQHELDSLLPRQSEETHPRVDKETQEGGKLTRKPRSAEMETDPVDEEPKETQEGKLPRRARSAETHNDQERRRRERIKEKIKALQDLIPNCCETNPASILDGAIAHIQALKSLLEVMTMRQGAAFQSQNPFILQQQTYNQPIRVPEFYPAMWQRMPFNMGMNNIVSPSPSSNFPMFRDNSQSPGFHPMIGGTAVPMWPPHLRQMPMVPFQTQVLSFTSVPFQTQRPVRSPWTSIVEPSQIVRPSTSRRKTTREFDKESKYPSSSQA